MSLDFVHADRNEPDLNKIICRFVSTASGLDRDFGPCASMGVLRDGKIIGGVVFHDWLPENGTIEISGAAISPKWFVRKTVSEIARVCFEALGANQVIARCDAENERACKIFRALRFYEITIPNMRGPDRHEAFFYIPRKDWGSVRLK